MDNMMNNTQGYPVQEQVAAPAAAPKNETVGFWAFLGLIVLFAIPIVGFIACIVFMFAPEKKSMKNYARAMMTWMVVNVLTTALIVSLLFSALGAALLPAINDSLGTEFESFGEVIRMANAVSNGDYSAVLPQFEEQLVELMGEEYRPFVEELCGGEYNELIEQVQNEEYDALLEDINNGEYDELLGKLSKKERQKLVEDLEAAAKGEASEVFGELNALIPEFKL